MALKVERVDTWAAPLEDRAGRLAEKLNALTGAGVNLEFIIVRSARDKSDGGVVFVTPIRGVNQTKVAREVGFVKSASLHTVRVEGPNRPGYGLNIVEALAYEGFNIRGFTAASIGNRFVAHVALASSAEASKAMRILRKG
jgi:hypothetical protein